MGKQESLALVMPHKATLIDCMRGAWSDLETMAEPAERAKFTLTTRANVFYSLACWRLAMEFGSEGPVRFVERGLLRYLQLDGETFAVALRPKKLDDGFHTSNVQTGQQLEIRQGLLANWAELPLSHVVLGYRLTDDPLEPCISEIWLTKEGKRSILWRELLWGDSDSESQPATIISPVGAPRPVVSPKRKKQNQDG